MPAIPIRRTRTGRTKDAYVSLYAVPHLLIGSYPKVKEEKKPATNAQKRLDDICKNVCKHYSISEEELKGKGRLREVVSARHMFFFISSFTTEKTMVALGKYLNRDHTTVVYAKGKIISFIQVGDQPTISALKKLCPPAIDVYCKSQKNYL